MIIGKVLGNVWATKKDPKIGGHKLLVIRTLGGAEGSETMVAVDTIGAGVGEDVLVTKGSVARNSLGDRDSPIDAVVVGIIDSLEVDPELLAAPSPQPAPPSASHQAPAKPAQPDKGGKDGRAKKS
jgi:ethanolamine utilization protein EutN